MSKCLLTGDETNNKTNNFPLSTKGRLLLVDVTNKYNDKLLDKFLESYKKTGSNLSDDAIESVKRLAPKLSKHDMLKMLSEESEEEIFARFEDKEESDDQQD